MGNDYEALQRIMKDRWAAINQKEPDLAEVLADIEHRLDRLEQHFSEQGINDLAHAIELRIVSRLKYGRNPWIERSEQKG